MYLFLLTGRIDKDANSFINLIASFLGIIFNYLFIFVRYFTIENSMGIAIILFTIVARLLMLPLGFKQQKSIVAMRRIQPEMDKIKAKYGDSKDPETQRKMSAEIQTLYSSNNVSPLGGCLPMLILLPIFFALSYLLRSSYLYLGEMGDIYNNISNILSVPLNLEALGTSNKVYPELMETFKSIINVKTIAKGLEFDTENISHLTKMLNSFSIKDWDILLGQLQKIPGDAYVTIKSLYEQKVQIESFFGINLIDNAGWSVTTILTGITQFVSTWIMNKQNSSSQVPQSMKTQQTVMLVVGPVMMAWMCTSLSQGVGIYWIVSSVCQTVQQVLLNNYYTKKNPDPVINGEKAEKLIVTVDKSKINKNSKKGAR